MRLTTGEIRSQRRLLLDIETDKLRCRVGGIRHWWDMRQPLPAWVKQYRGQIVRASQCIHCGAIKREVHTKKYGERINYRVWYPDNYLITKTDDWNESTPTMSSAAVRMELAARIEAEGTTLGELDLLAVTPGGEADG